MAPGVFVPNPNRHDSRPADFRGMKVPDILLSGHHAKIADWRKMMGRERTAANRPDLLGE